MQEIKKISIKRYAMFFSLAVVFSFVAPSASASSDLSAWWPFDEGTGSTAYDETSNGNDATLSGISWASGALGDAGEYDGSASSSLVDDDSAIQNIWDGGGTISAWIEPDTDGEGDNGRILDKYYWFINIGYDDGSDAYLYFRMNFSSSYGWWRTDGKVIPLDEASHIAVSYDSDSASNDPVIYVNGESVAITEYHTPSGTRISDSGADLYIGSNYGSSGTFDGWIDEPRIYDRELSAGEALLLYRKAAGHWPFDEGTGSAADDASADDNDAALSSVSWATGILDDAGEYDGSASSSAISDDITIEDIFDNGGTVSAWIEPDTDGEGDNGRIFDKYQWFANIGYDDGSDAYLYFRMNFSSDYGWWRTDSKDIPLNEPSHIAISYDSNSSSNDPVIYINGSSVSITEYNTPSGTRTSDDGYGLYVGSNYGSSGTFDGWIDEPMAHDTALSSSEVEALYHGADIIESPADYSCQHQQEETSFSGTCAVNGTDNYQLKEGAATLGTFSCTNNAWSTSVSDLDEGEHIIDLVYGGDAWDTVTFTLANTAPTVFIIDQHQSGDALITEGATIGNNQINIKATLNDADLDKITLEVELRTCSSSICTDNFTDTATHSSSPPVSSGTQVTVSLNSPSEDYYHWQYRAVDEFGKPNGGGDDGWNTFGYDSQNIDFRYETGYLVLEENSVDGSENLYWQWKDGSTQVYSDQWGYGITIWSDVEGVTGEVNIEEVEEDPYLEVEEVNFPTVEYLGWYVPTDLIQINKPIMNTATENEQRSACAHELGHALGLDHSYSGNIMYFESTDQIAPGEKEIDDYDYLWGD